MIVENGTLRIGVEHGGKVHRDFTLKPQLVKDSVEVMDDERAQKNDSYFGVCLLSKQFESLGDIPKEEITPELVMTMMEIDLRELFRAKEALESRLGRFRGEGETPEKAGSGAD